MRSIGVRLAFWYTIASCVTLGCFFRVGRFLVEQHMIHSIDLGLAAEFENVKRRLGNDAGSLGPGDVYQRMTVNPSVRFSIEILDRAEGVIYRSRNLNNRKLPETAMDGDTIALVLRRVFEAINIVSLPDDPAAVRHYNAVVGDLGEMRIADFNLDGRTVRVGVAKEQVRSMVAAFEEVFYVMVALTVIASAIIGYLLSNLLLRPLRQIRLTAEHISSSNLSERVEVSTVQDELSDLARLLNQTFDRLETSFNQVRRFTAEASHELKTPLSLMRLHAERLLTEGNLTPAQEESAHVLLEEIGRLSQMIEELLFISRAEAKAVTLSLKSNAPRPFLENFAQDARVLADNRQIQFVSSHEGDGTVEFDSRWIRQVLLNLLTNALNHTPPGRRVFVRSQVRPEMWRVTVDDEGPGVPAELREQIFERFFRLNQANSDKGSGLGLAICRSIISIHRGKIWAESAPNDGGLRVVFEIPRTGTAPAVPETAT